MTPVSGPNFSAPLDFLGASWHPAPDSALSPAPDARPSALVTLRPGADQSPVLPCGPFPSPLLGSQAAWQLPESPGASPCFRTGSPAHCRVWNRCAGQGVSRGDPDGSVQQAEGDLICLRVNPDLGNRRWKGRDRFAPVPSASPGWVPGTLLFTEHLGRFEGERGLGTECVPTAHLAPHPCSRAAGLTAPSSRTLGCLLHTPARQCQGGLAGSTGNVSLCPVWNANYLFLCVENCA